MLVAYDSTIGLDVSIPDFATMSNGIKIDNPKFLTYSIKRLKILQKRLNQKKKWLFNFFRVDWLWQRRLTTEDAEGTESCFSPCALCAPCGVPDQFRKILITLSGPGQFEPFPKMCIVCGSINRGLKLTDLKWTCAECAVLHDRNVNEGINIKKFAPRDQNLIGLIAPADLQEMSPMNESMNREGIPNTCSGGMSP